MNMGYSVCNKCQYRYSECCVLGCSIGIEAKDGIKYCRNMKPNEELRGMLSIAEGDGKLSISEPNDTGGLSVV